MGQYNWAGNEWKKERRNTRDGSLVCGIASAHTDVVYFVISTEAVVRYAG